MLMCDFGNLAAEVEKLTRAGVRALHLDVMDGRFVPNLTYGMPIVAGLNGLTDMLLDVHLMIEQPERYISEFIEAGADSLTVHIEAVADPRAVLKQIRDGGVAAGLAINPGTSLNEVMPYVDDCDLVLAMSVEPGFGGQSFNPVALEKLSELSNRRPDHLLLEVDGGVNPSTVDQCAGAGADLLVVGSAIFKHESYEAAVAQLHSLIS